MKASKEVKKPQEEVVEAPTQRDVIRKLATLTAGPGWMVKHHLQPRTLKKEGTQQPGGPKITTYMHAVVNWFTHDKESIRNAFKDAGLHSDMIEAMLDNPMEHLTAHLFAELVALFFQVDPENLSKRSTECIADTYATLKEMAADDDETDSEDGASPAKRAKHDPEKAAIAKVAAKNAIVAMGVKRAADDAAAAHAAAAKKPRVDEPAPEPASALASQPEPEPQHKPEPQHESDPQQNNNDEDDDYVPAPADQQPHHAEPWQNKNTRPNKEDAENLIMHGSNVTYREFYEDKYVCVDHDEWGPAFVYTVSEFGWTLKNLVTGNRFLEAKLEPVNPAAVAGGRATADEKDLVVMLRKD